MRVETDLQHRAQAGAERTLRLAHFTTILGSAKILLRAELEVDVASGAKVYVICGGDQPSRELLGCEVVSLSSLRREWSPLRDLRAAYELYRVLRELNLDVLHTHMPKAGVLGRVIGRLAGVPVVVNTCHGLWARPEDHLLVRLAVLAAEGVSARFSDFELYQNAQDAAAMRWAVPAEQASVVGNGVDLSRFSFDQAGRDRVRSELGISSSELLVGAVGRIIESKGVVIFDEVASQLQDRARFVWIGPEDPTHPDARRIPTGTVRYLGMREDMVAVMSALDVFVHPSFAREGLSRASMEAAAVGRPIITTDVRGCRDIGRPYREILVVPPRSVEALVDAVSLLLDSSGLRERLGGNAASHAQRCFDQRVVAATSLCTYEKVAARKGFALPRPQHLPGVNGGSVAPINSQ